MSGNRSNGNQGATTLRLVNLTKLFDEVVAVDHIDLEISSGEFVTLLGPSGSGKTTTLMMIAGFEDPTEGNLYLDDAPLAGIPSYRRGFGMVFQNYSLFPHMTVADNIGFPLRMRGIGRAQRQQRVNSVLEMVQLPGYGHRYPNQLSGGQQQRIALARALVYNPPVLLMDEPLGALDKKLREGMQLEIKRIQSELDITTVYVTHDQEEALVLSDRIAVMNNGRIEQVDTPANLYENPTTRFVADFIGESNIISISLQQDNGNRFAVTAGGRRLSLPDNPATLVEHELSFIIRPEKMYFVDEHDANRSDVLPGRIEELIYVGDITRYRVRISDTESVIVKRQNRFGERHKEPGEQCLVSWHVDDASLVSG